jgi:peroxiredoxin/mono/diheme cytochrome c family protein
LSAAAGATMSAAVEIGDRIDGFTLPDIHGRDRTLGELADKPLVVVAFLGTECPLARLYGPRLQALSESYAARGVAFVGIDANQQDSLADLTVFARQYGVQFPLLKDRDSGVADKFGAVRNPEVFVLDRSRAIRYRGRVDDQYGLGSSSGYSRSAVKSRDLGDALDALLAGKKVSRPSTGVTGCIIGRKAKSQPRGEVTYTKHIAALLQNRCVACHRPGQSAPFALTDYDEVVGWGEMIKEVVSEGRMPPWSANPQFGHFANDARLSEAEKQLINSWVDNGCPQGEPADLSPAKKWVDGWTIGQPEQVLHMETAFDVPTEGVIPYQMFVVDPGWTEDKWIQRAEVLPSNRGVVHHIIAMILPPGGSGPSGEDAEGGAARRPARVSTGTRVRRSTESLAAMGDEFGGTKLTSYVPGRPATAYQSGVAMFAPARSKIGFQIHYTPNGRECQDKSYIGLVFSDPSTVKKRAHVLGVTGFDFQIPPYTDNYKVTAEMAIHTDQLLLSMSPHMHLRGKSFRYQALFPDGTSEILVDVPKYDFNWQLTYELVKPKLLPAGSKLQCIAYYDNSEDNVANPDPSKTITWGSQTWDEMMIGYYAVVTVEDDAHRAGVKRAKPSTATEAQ